MVKISIDEAAAFDMLSILEVKCDKSHGSKHKIVNQLGVQLETELKEQIGEDLYNKILSSKEYNGLYTINESLFQLVDKSKNNQCTPKELDEANYLRYLAKKLLQNTFFPAELTETKLGYENIFSDNNGQ